LEQTLHPSDPVAYLFPDSSILGEKNRKILELQSTYLLCNQLFEGTASLPFELGVVLQPDG